MRKTSDMLAILILLAPVFSNYIFWGALSIGDLFLFLFLFLFLLQINIGIKYLFVILFSFFVFVFGYVNIVEVFDFGFLRMCFYYFVFLLITGSDFAKKYEFIEIYKKLSLFFAFSIIVQWLLFAVLGLNFSLKLPIDSYEMDTMEFLGGSVFRSGGWFKEPSYYALYVIPVMIYFSRHREIIPYTICTISLLMSTSSLGVLLIFYSLIEPFLLNLKISTNKILSVVIISLFLVFVAIYFRESTTISRIYDIFENGGTLNDRLLPVFRALSGGGGIFPEKDIFVMVKSASVDEGTWYSSAIYIYACFGWLGIILYMGISFRMGFLMGMWLIFLCATTHFISTPYCLLIIFAMRFLDVDKENRSINLSLKVERN